MLSLLSQMHWCCQTTCKQDFRLIRPFRTVFKGLAEAVLNWASENDVR